MGPLPVVKVIPFFIFESVRVVTISVIRPSSNGCIATKSFLMYLIELGHVFSVESSLTKWPLKIHDEKVYYN